jgi:PadR family transcriptional regulator, regulatory protein PadR
VPAPSKNGGWHSFSQKTGAGTVFRKKVWQPPFGALYVIVIYLVIAYSLAPMSWTTQLRKGALELAVLNALNGDRLYGYDIVRLLRRHDGLMIGDGTVYPILSRLKADGLVLATIEDSPDGPPRKYYELTKTGREALTEMNHAWETLVSSVEELRHAAHKAGT